MSTPIPAAFRTLDLNLLRVFDDVMAERSLTRAAHTLSLTQPAVSNALRRLRDALGDELVRRHGHGIEPTPRALALWPSVREALRQLQAAIVPRTFEPQQANRTFVLAIVLLRGLTRVLAQNLMTHLDAWSAQLARRRADQRLWDMAQKDPRLMRDLEVAMDRAPEERSPLQRFENRMNRRAARLVRDRLYYI